MRKSGILMPVSSLPGGYGIGSLGKAAYQFVDFMEQAGQTVWQILPVAPTGYGDSPYQSCSAFAGNPYFLDLDILAEDGLLKKGDYAKLPWGEDAAAVDYAALYAGRFAVLRKAYANWRALRPVTGYDTPYGDDWYRFTLGASWLEDYALYMAIKQSEEMHHWLEWPTPLRTREPAALAKFKAENAEEIEFWMFIQYLFDKQWHALKAYANAHGVQIMGDIPIYVSADSADAWAGGKLFELDGEGKPRRVAGCPPDYFSADGQLWGNPLYDWAYHKETGYAWWKQRIRHALTTYDILRIDHFRGFDTYWAIPAGAENARGGKWENGPGMDLFNALQDTLGTLPIIAEDLGELFPSVRTLLRESGFPGMKVVQFGCSGGDSEYLPHNYIANCVAYPGTHDNTTLAAWLAENPKEAARAKAYFALSGTAKNQVYGILRGIMASCADLAVTPLYDWLVLGSEARLNTPGRLGGNWSWRMLPGALTPALAKEIRTMTECYCRCAPAKKG